MGSLLHVRQAEDPLGDDIELDFRRAAGNGQGLVIERKTFIQLNVRQQVDLITIRRGSDCIVQCGVVVRIVDLVDLAHRRGCGAAVVVRRAIVIRFLVRSFGGEIPCGQVIRCFIAVRIWSLTLYVPDKAVALLMLGLSPFVLRVVPMRWMPATLGPAQALGGGIACMALMLLTGVTGPLVDQLFLRSPMNRQQIVATKASCQVFGHGSKLLYFGALIEQAGSVEPWVLVMAVGASMLGTSLGKQILERLSDAQFRTWAGRLITVLGLYYVGYGLVLLTGIA